MHPDQPQRATDVRLRPVQAGDEPFLREVYGSTRMDELAVTNWTVEQKRAFVEMQFAAQRQHYMEHYADASFSVILERDVPVGRLYVARWEREIRIVDIALLPDFRGRGIGGALISKLLEEGRATGRSVSIHVERFNPALRLYARLGFRLTEDKGVYLLMTWHPMEVQG
jgi:GNAT superfamily N-acetyltransferase